MIGVIADDLTGAAEIGAVGLRHGLRAEVIVTGEPGGDADLICVDTDSRSLDPTEAAQRAARAAVVLQNCGAEWIYKKTDSLLRGNVTAEIEAALKQLGLSGALLVPANPSLGRTILNGQYFVRGQLINETEFARDPKHPRSSPQVLELLDHPSVFAVFVRKPNEPLPHRGIVIGEVASSQSLSSWASGRNGNWLMSGGAEFFAALLKPAAPLPQATWPSGRELFVCGSASEATKAFVVGQVQCGVPAFSLPDEVLTTGDLHSTPIGALAAQVVAALETQPRVIVHVGLPPVTDVPRAGMVAAHLVRVAEEVLRRASIGHVFAEGGATAVALARRMGWSRLAVAAELTPGVVSLTIMDAGAALLTVKPGSYAWPTTIVNAARMNSRMGDMPV
jgi:uncharacterized protein YgbK (DUF1537 family)